jgi:TATA-box binding protein (TBP) (component of TFIID and TFIIIB)
MDDKQVLYNKLSKVLDIKKLPEDVIISTMTICCKMNIQFNVDNIAKYIDLKSDGILSVYYGKEDDINTNRSLNKKKKKNKKKKNYKKKPKREFQNQISLNVIVPSKKKPINIKLFKNGSIQMTGCKSLENIIDVLSKILFELQTVKAIIDYSKMIVVEKPFVNNLNMLELKYINNVTVGMINSNFTYPLKIDRIKLYNLLVKDNMKCNYDPNSGSAVCIKYDCGERIISIFVFEKKGSILITGVKNCKHILEAYNFINKYLLTNRNLIYKSEIDIDDILNIYHKNITNINGLHKLDDIDNIENIENIENIDDIDNIDDIENIDDIDDISLNSFEY